MPFWVNFGAMSPRHRVSRNAIELIKRFEGYRRKAAQLPDGRWTIGYGHTLTAREGAEVSEEDAEALLIYDLIAVAHAVNEHALVPLTQNQFDALCSFAFNLGLDAFRTSQVLKRLNAGETVQAACAMELWRKAEFQGQRIVLDALVRRRSAEKALFLTPPGDAWVPAPSPVLRPLVDLDARELIPSEAPTELVASLEGDRVVVSRDGEPLAVPPPIEDETPGRAVRAAAEAVTARLQTIFPENEPEPAPEPPAEPEAAEPEAAEPHEVRPQADFAPPITTLADGADEAEAAPPTVTTYPQEPAAPEAAPEGSEVPPEVPERPEEFPEELPEEIPEGALEAPAPANDASLVLDAPFEGRRIVIDDMAVHEFIPARVAPLPRRKEDGLFAEVALALLGLAFFGFGIFWGLNARAGAVAAFPNPLLVAWAAGVAGVGFFVVAVYRLLERLGRLTERD